MLAYLQKGGQMVVNFLRPKKKLGWISFVFLSVLLLAVFLSVTPAVHAVDVWDTVANMISRFCLMVATFFMKLTIFCLTFIIQIAAYNGYLDSTAVNYGWVMVRDIANMFFVVVLLLIAFGTILGLDQYEWKKMMVKFVMAAILVNFSRLICGVIIDIGQVVMVTFINGVAATAGGNLITMFNFVDIMSLTGQQEVNGSEVLMASVASVGFAAMALGIMVVFVVMLMGRMITLWVLIVLSPLAFVLSIIPQTQKYASDWWNQFGNNVVAGPVIAFFLWLAFVTVGNGNINNEISGNSQTDVKITDAETATEDVGAQSAGISSAMSWSKMANFAIAIGMLLVGAKTAQQLGTAGGNMMSKATDFAKKATMVAAGVTAGKWAYDKGVKPAAKWGAMNVPLVGGKAWQRRGRTIAGVARGGWEILGKKRDDKAADLEKKGLEAKGAKGLWTKAWTGVSASFLMTQKKAEKKADAYKDVAENLSTWHEKNISSSGTWIGQRKTETGILAEEAKTFSQTKGKSKAVVAREKMLRDAKEGTGGVMARGYAGEMSRMEKSIIDETRRTQDVEAGYGTAQKEAMRRKTNQFLQIKIDETKPGGHDFGGDNKLKADYERWRGLQSQQAVFTQLQRETDQQTEILAAIEKDKLYKEAGLAPQFEQQVRAAHQKEKEDRLGSMTFRELTSTTGLLAGNIQKERNNLAKATDDAAKEVIEGRLKRLLEEQAAALAANAKRGSEFFEEALKKASIAVGFDGVVKASDFQSMQAKLLSGLLGRNVEKGGLEEADSELRVKYGDSYNVIMRNISEALKVAAKDGSVNAAGLINDSIVDDETGSIQYALHNDSGKVEEARTYYAEEVNVSKLTSLRDMTAKNAEGGFVDFSSDKTAISQLISAFGNMSINTKLHNRLVNEFNGYVGDDGTVSDDVKNSYAKFFKEFLQTKRESAEALLFRMPEAFVKALVANPATDGSAEIIAALENLASRVKKGGGRNNVTQQLYPSPDPDDE